MQEMRGATYPMPLPNRARSKAPATLIGGFLFQAVDPILPFYLFTAAEIIAAFFLISLVREPEKKEI